MRKKHLELIQKNESFFIQINTVTGRVSLLFDHPVFNWVMAKDLKNLHYQTRGKIQLVPMRQKDLFIMEDVDLKGFKAQNFVYAADEISEQFEKLTTKSWALGFGFEFLTKSISIFYLLVYSAWHYYVFYHYGYDGIARLSWIFGPPAMILIPSLYYFFWSSKTRSSILKFFFRFELMLMLVAAVAYLIIYILMPPAIQVY
ncbi:MAG: hypothetical protein H7328_05745 [Bdellovibrio sp.]|nr:hypothetical protein [Bdellovibrio sp.]